ncbi:sugar ABC transporter ATP-binding protein [Labrys wisconsinensis]|uniref:ABC-type sugar transport system ATPase subunit n=1 Tax=Labrys wisconsinensis TaxID=425677 RepID=A0ABU0J193_9HYPH|nr:sugar ABC transporter ATP-binding protein [Labrys wisconsinensis]MDQ0467326.1 ABC-type sugar transport system ATPase subunit [Labrys wisconsinensis]
MLRMTKIAKRYGAAVALESVDLEVRRGEVMALLGENGAGKSTLVKILAGVETPDAGTIEIAGTPRAIRSPVQSQAAGIAYVAQELSIVETLSVAENVFLGDGSVGVWRSPARLARLAGPFLARVGLDHVDPLQAAGSISVAERQLVEIARLLSRKAVIAILDEPTAALSDAEIARVKAAVRALSAEGCAIVYVTHRLGEVFELAGRVTIIRNGRSFPPVATASLDVDGLIERMLGRRLDQMFPPRAEAFGETLLAVEAGLCRGLQAPLSFRLRQGEILALAGQVGSGANAVLRMLAGTVPAQQGRLTLAGRPYAPRSIADAIAAGVGYCSDDRKRDGIFAARSLVENLSAPALDRVTRLALIDAGAERAHTRTIAGQFGLDPDRLGRLAGHLSGGNQQKVALGKWIGLPPRLLLVEEPTRGVDVGARAEIYRHLRAQAQAGLAILFSSSDTQEVLGLADRVATFYHGRLVGLAEAAAHTVESITRDVTHPDLAA